MSEVEEAEKRGKLAGLRYAASLCNSRKLPMYHVAYHAALDDLKLFCEAAAERVEAGEQMESIAVCQ